MFKPLLRTLPSLSGNFTLSCKLNNIQKENQYNYYTYARIASLMPLQNNINVGNIIDINLLSGRYEYDIPKYFNKYSNYFYKENINYNKSNYKLLDLYSLRNEDNDDRNKDYEFGCKRSYISKTGYQFSFYAPIYIDNINDLPEYFCIHIKLSNNIEKKIKIYINKKSSINYLKNYLSNYLKNIDDRVIFCLRDSLQATYYGVDVKNGGIVKYKDNIFGNIYINQTTINNFDKTICQGFERNNLIMRQIIPLSFMFNINDILDDNEKEYFFGHKVNITGYYYSSYDIKYDMYDFDINYWNLYLKYKKFDEKSGKYFLSNGYDSSSIINVANIGYPALNEDKYIKYEFENKITPNYCKFKMLLSDDKDPYISNMNFGYSYLQCPNQKYGYFPTMFKGINAQLVCEDRDIKLPIGSNINTYYCTNKYFANKVYMNSSNYNKYKKLMENYASSWFNIINNFDDINTIINDESLWSDVKYDYSYYNGILYDLNKLKDININKFGVFLSFDINYVSTDDLNKKYSNARYVLSKTNDDNNISNITINEYNDLYDLSYLDETTNIEHTRKLYNSINSGNGAYLHFNKTMIKDPFGKYVKEKSYYKANKYYIVNDIINFILNEDNIDSSNELYEKTQDILFKINDIKIDGYIVLNAYNNINYFESVYDNKNIESKRIILYNLFNSKDTSYYSKYDWLKDSLYCYNPSTNKKQKLSEVYNQISYDENVYEKINLLMKYSFIHENDIINILYDNISDTTLISEFINKLNNLDSYIYERYGNSNGIEIYDYFVKSNTYDDLPIYVDSYNLNNLITSYNKYYKNDKLNYLSNFESKNFYIKILNKDHLIEYFYKLNNNEDNESLFNNASTYLFDRLFVKKRLWNIGNNTLNINDAYIPLYEYVCEYFDINKNIIKDKINKDIVSLYDEENNQTYYHSKYVVSFLKAYLSKNNEIMLSWLLNHISDTRSLNNRFALSFGNVELEIDLCIYKNVYKLNENLYKLLMNVSQFNVKLNYLYLYIQDDCKKENADTWNIYNYNDIIAKFNGIHIKEINDYLVPLFTNIYVNDNDINTLYNMIQNKKIQNYMYSNNINYFKEIDDYKTLYNIYNSKEYIISDFINRYHLIKNDQLKDNLTMIINSYPQQFYNIMKYYFKIDNNMTYAQIVNYNEETLDKLIYVIKNEKSKELLIQYLKDNNIKNEFNDYIFENDLNDSVDVILSFLKTKYVTLYYNLFEINNIELYSIYDMLNISMNNISNDKLKYDEDNKIYTYESNGIKYGFYNIHINIDNTNNTFDIQNDFNLNITFDSINGFNIKDHTNDFFSSNIKLLYPFMKTNIFSEFSKQISTIIYPYENEILIKFKSNKLNNINEYKKYQSLQENSTDILYDKLVELPQYKKIKLLRYFNYITPYIKKVSSINDFYTFKFMEYNNLYNDINKANILIKQNIDIFKYNPLNVYNTQYDKNIEDFEYIDKDKKINSIKVNQFEYKHFNDNLLYNLPEYLEYVDETEYKYADINELNERTDKEEKINNMKLDILYKIFNKNKDLNNNDILFLFNKYNSSFFIEKYKNSYKIRYKFNLI